MGFPITLPEDFTVVRLFLLVLMTTLWACRDSRSPVAPDTTAPGIEFVFPASGSFDRDADGLVDVEVAFADSGSGVSLSRVSLISDRGVSGGGGSSLNLLEAWRVERLDGGGFVVEETVEHLLPRGDVHLQVTVVDSAGNRSSEAVEIDLPPAALHRIVDLDVSTFLSTSLLVRPDGRRVYVTTEEFGGSAMTVVDGQTFDRIKTERTSQSGLTRMAWDARRNRVYAMSIDEPFLATFDASTETFGPLIQTAARGIAVAVSSRRDRVYVGLEAWGLIGVIDPALGVLERVIELDLPDPDDPSDARLTLISLVFDPEERFLYTATRIDTQQGLLVIDPDEGILVNQIDLWPEWSGLGGGLGLIRNSDFLAIASGTPDGTGRIVQFPFENPGAMRFGQTGLFANPMRVAANPSGIEYAVVSGDQGSGYFALMLIDAHSLQIVWEERFPRPPAGMRQDVAFRPDGNVFFVVGTREDTEFELQPNELSVYLYRSP